MHIINFISCL